MMADDGPLLETHCSYLGEFLILAFHSNNVLPSLQEYCWCIQGEICRCFQDTSRCKILGLFLGLDSKVLQQRSSLLV